MDAAWWCGVVGVVFAGWALSSYASNFSYRLARGEDLFTRKPFCGECNALLTPKDLIPIFSFLLTDGKCRYCGLKIPFSYYVMELLGPLLFLTTYVYFGIGDLFLVVALSGLALIVLAMMAVEDGFVSGKALLGIAAAGVCMQALVQNTVLDALMGAFIAGLVAVGVHRLQQREPKEFHLHELPVYVWLAATFGCWFPLGIATELCMAWLLLWLIFTRLRKIFYRTHSAMIGALACVMIPAMFWWSYSL